MGKVNELIDGLRRIPDYMDHFSKEEMTLIDTQQGQPEQTFPEALTAKIRSVLASEADKLRHLIGPQSPTAYRFWAGPSRTVTLNNYRPHVHPDFTPVILPLTRYGKPFPIILERYDYEDAKKVLRNTKGLGELTTFHRYFDHVNPNEDPYILIARSMDGNIEALGIRVVYGHEDGTRRVAFVRGVKFDRNKDSEIQYIGIAINMALLRHLKAKGIWHPENIGPIIEGILPELLAKWRERLGYKGELFWDDSVGASEANYYMHDIGLHFIDLTNASETAGIQIAPHSKRGVIERYLEVLDTSYGQDLQTATLSNIWLEAIKILKEYSAKEAQKYLEQIHRLALKIEATRLHPFYISPLIRLANTNTTDHLISYRFQPMEIEVLKNGQTVQARVDLLSPNEASYVLDDFYKQQIQQYKKYVSNALIFVLSVAGKIEAICVSELQVGPFGKTTLTGLNTLTKEPNPNQSQYKRLSFALMLARLAYFQEHGLSDNLDENDPLIKSIESYVGASWRKIVYPKYAPKSTPAPKYTTWSLKEAQDAATVWQNRSKTLGGLEIIPENDLNPDTLLTMAADEEHTIDNDLLSMPWMYTGTQPVFSPITGMRFI